MAARRVLRDVPGVALEATADRRALTPSPTFAPWSTQLTPFLTPEDYDATATEWTEADLGPSAAAGYTPDAAGTAAQMEALRALQELADRGFTSDERRTLEADYRTGAGIADSGDAGAAQRRAYAGVTDSRLAQQGAAQEASVARSAFDRDLRAEEDVRRRAATQALSSVAGAARAGSFADASRAAELQDILNRSRADFSTIRAQQNAQNQNRVAEANSRAGERYASDTLDVGGRMLEEYESTRQREAERQRLQEEEDARPFTTVAELGGGLASTALGGGWESGASLGRYGGNAVAGNSGSGEDWKRR